MSDPYLGEIRMFAGTFAPMNWNFCNGALLSIGSNQALFSLLGTYYGGDGRSTFGLPDLCARIPVDQGQGPGTSNYYMGQKGGFEQVSLSTPNLPSHTHQLQGSTTAAAATNPTGNVTATAPNYMTQSPDATMAPECIEETGGSAAHYNMQPYLVINFIICLNGIYPSRQ